MSEESEKLINEILENAAKDLAINRPFKRAERLDTVSSSILQTSGVMLTILVAIFSLATGKSNLAAEQMPFPVAAQLTLIAGCGAFVLAMIFLIFSIRSREIKTPERINKESYFDMLKKISKINDFKKKLQDAGLLCLILGAILTLFVVVIWIL